MTVIHVPPAMLPSSGSMWKLRQGTINKWEKHYTLHMLLKVRFNPPASPVLCSKVQHSSESPKGLDKAEIAGPHPRVSDSVCLDRAQDFTLLTWCCWSRDHTFRTPIWRKVLTDSLTLGNQKPSVHQNNPEFLLPLERASRSPLVPNSTHNSSYLSHSLIRQLYLIVKSPLISCISTSQRRGETSRCCPNLNPPAQYPPSAFPLVLNTWSEWLFK